MSQSFLPLTREDMRQRGWDEVDFVFVIGDAYVDHPSFGHAIISRLLEQRGYKVGMIAQPDWKDKSSISVFGKPRLAFLVSGGNMDSMVNHYTVSKKRRKSDAYTPGGLMGKRPDYAAVVYGNLIRQTYKTMPIILGGVEASLRRLAHYDYWSNKIKRSVLLDAQADLLVYGMGEKSMLEVAEALNNGFDIKDITFVDGTLYKTKNIENIPNVIMLPSYESVQSDKKEYARSFYVQYCNADPFSGKTLAEYYPNQNYAVQNPPQKPMTEKELDEVYSLNYMRQYHPSYAKAGGVPALEEVRFSLTSSRGCFGGCSFCALTFHQGKIVQSRSHESILSEAKLLTQEPDFKGYIHDVGGPTANFRQPACKKQATKGACMEKQCLFPKPCGNLMIDHKDYLQLLRKLRALPHIKKVFIRSGIRFDYLIYDKDDSFIRELVQHHISGQLKVAPEHVSDRVLEKMGKPGHAIYLRFLQKYNQLNKAMDKNQFVVPYFMSSHPGSTMQEAVALAEYLRDLGYTPEQVQDFYPTPSTISTCMYYTGYDPRTMEEVYVPTAPHEKAMQRALIQFRNPKNRSLVREALVFAGRTDLIGYGKKCLIRPEGERERQESQRPTQDNRAKQKNRKPARVKKEAPSKDKKKASLTAAGRRRKPSSKR
ncbi:MAG: YgiQ family radical SAM protein [Christensenellales bacterium]